MTRRFNTAGPCVPQWHYMIPALRRLPEAPGLVDLSAYFVVHAPRQTGKTTALRALAAELTASGRYAAVLFSCELGRAFADDPQVAQEGILQEIRTRAHDALPAQLRPPPWPAAPEASMLGEALRAWAQVCPRPIVLFFDEIDALRGPTLLSVLSQLRAGYNSRPAPFPQSVILCGLRDVRDYKAASGGDPNRLGTASPFNIKLKSLRLGNFPPDEVRELDSLVARLAEPRVRRVLEPVLAGTLQAGDTYTDDLQYVRDLGLAAPDNPVRVANPIYHEVIARVLTGSIEPRILIDEPRTFVRPDGSLDLDRILHEFAEFWREHGDVLITGAVYHEVAQQLVLMAYLQRVVNGGGYVQREYGVGRGRIDVLIRWPRAHPEAQREAVELKVWRPDQPDPIHRGLSQLDGYLDRLGLDHGTLVVFDRRPDAAPLPERTRFETATTASGRPVTILRA